MKYRFNALQRWLPTGRRLSPCVLTASLLVFLAPSAPASGQNAVASTDLIPVTATYRAEMDKGISIDGSGKRTLRALENGLWRYETDVESFVADIEESLTFRWDNGRVIPIRYRYSLSGFFIKDRKRAIDFDWNNMVATGHYRGDKFSLPLEPGTLDPLGFQLQLRQDIKAGLTDVTYRVLDKDDFDTDRFAILGQESLSLNGEQVTAIKAEKVRGEGSKRKTLMWFAPDRDYLLVRLLQVEPDGSEYELSLDEATLRR